MTFDELQDKWQSHQPKCKLNTEADYLLKEVKRNKQYFEAMIFWRDFRETVVAFILVGIFGYFGIISHSWGTITMALMCLFVGGSIIVDRILQKRNRPKYDDSLTGCIADSLAQVTHQIWGLKSVFWWYLLPLLIGAACMTGEFGWNLRNNTEMFWSHIIKSTLIWGLLCWGVYELNQWAVRSELIPRQKELQQLLDTISNSDGE
jgi:hypothetical protein